MADRLTAEQLAKFSGRVVRARATRTAVIDNDAISATDITAYVKRWNQIRFEVYGKSPTDPGTLRFPVLTLTVDNSSKIFDRGGALFPNGTPDFASTTIHATISAGGITILDFIGCVREPEYSHALAIDLVAEHPLTQINRRVWTRDDRIGGDTGIDWLFNS